MTSLRNLNSAVQNAEFPSHDFAQAVREWIAAATERMEPARFLPCGCVRCICENENRCQGCGAKNCGTHNDPPAAKVECQNCHKEIPDRFAHWEMDQPLGGPPLYFCKPAQPKPAPPSEMSEATPCRGCGQNHDGVRCEDPAPALRMTPELETVLIAAHAYKLSLRGVAQSDHYCGELNDAIAAVRAQASQPQGVKLKVVRAYFTGLSKLPQYKNKEGSEFLAQMLAELDAAEGKVTG